MPTATDYAELIIESAQQHIRTGRSDTTAEDLRAVVATVAQAIAFLQNLQAGAKILHAAGAPDPVIGVEGDAYINELNGDLHFKDETGWNFRLTLKGARGDNGKDGKNGTNGTNGTNGLSAYQLAVGSGYLGSQSAWLASLNGYTPVKGVDYEDGQDGSRNRWESYAPKNEAGNLGDAWFHTISATKLAIYEYKGADAADASASPWRLRFTSPEPVTSTVVAPTTGNGGGTANYPAQTPSTTAGKYLKSTGTTGAEAWDSPNRCTVDLEFLQLLEVSKKFFLATQFLRFERDANIATLSYSINGAAAVNVPFDATTNQYTPAAPVAVPAGGTVVFTITYTSTASAAFAQVFAACAIPQL